MPLAARRAIMCLEQFESSASMSCAGRSASRRSVPPISPWFRKVRWLLTLANLGSHRRQIHPRGSHHVEQKTHPGASLSVSGPQRQQAKIEAAARSVNHRDVTNFDTTAQAVVSDSVTTEIDTTGDGDRR